MNQNRSAFLSRIADRLGRPTPKTAPELVFSQRARQLQDDVAQRAGVKNLAQLFATRLSAQGGKVATATSKAELLQHIFAHTNQDNVLPKATLWKDSRLDALGLPRLLTELGVHITTDPMQADFGITMAEWAVAETGTLALYNGPDKSRAVSLVPNTFIACIRESHIVPTLDYVLRDMRQVAQDGRLPSCINLIAGPSSSADIELQLVIGIHGPANVLALILADELFEVAVDTFGSTCPSPP